MALSLQDMKLGNMDSLAIDLEGTAVDVEFAHHQGHILAARDFGLELTLDMCLQFLPHFIGGPDDKVAEEIVVLAESKGTSATAVAVLERKRAHYNHLLETVSIQPRKGFLEFYHTVRSLGYLCTIGSLTGQEQAEVLLERSGLGSLFDRNYIVLREHVQHLKPAPDVWLETAKRAGVAPGEQIVFEDSPNGIRGAISVGAYCIGMPVYNRPETISSLLHAGAKRIFMQWDEMNVPTLLNNINQERYAAKSL